MPFLVPPRLHGTFIGFRVLGFRVLGFRVRVLGFRVYGAPRAKGSQYPLVKEYTLKLYGP